MPTAKTYGYEVLLKDGFTGPSKKVEASAKSQGRTVDSMGSAWKSAGLKIAGVAGAYVGVRAVYARANALIKESIELANTQIDAEVTLRSRLGESASEVQKYAAHLQDLTRVGDEQSIKAAARLSTYNLEADAINKLLLPIINMTEARRTSAKAGLEMSTGVDLLGRALQGQFTTLQRYGISLSDAEKAVLKTGTQMEKVEVLAAALDSRFGSMAENFANTVTGRVTQLQNAFGDLKEDLGRNVLESGALKAAIEQLIIKTKDFGGVLNGPQGLALVEDFAVASLRTADGILRIAHAMGEVKAASVGFGQLLGQSAAVVSLRLEDTLRNGGDPAALSSASAAAMRELDKTWKAVSSDIGQTFEESTFGGISEGINKAIAAIEANRGQRIEMPAGVAGGSAPGAQRTGGAAKGGPFDYQSAQRTTEAMAELNAEFLAWQQTNADTLKANDLLLASGGDVEAVRRQFGELEAAKTEIAQEADAERYANWLATEQEKAQAWQDAFQPRIDSFAEYAGTQFDIITGALSRGIADAFIDGEFNAEELGRQVLRSALQVTIQTGLQLLAYQAIQGTALTTTAVQTAGAAAQVAAAQTGVALESAMFGFAQARLAIEIQIAAVRAASGFGGFLFHGGGLIRHDGGPIIAHSGRYFGRNLKSDEVPVIAQRGEYMMQRSAVKKIGVGNLERMNQTGQLGTIDRNGQAGVTMNNTFQVTAVGGGSAREQAERLAPELIRIFEREHRRGALKLGA